MVKVVVCQIASSQNIDANLEMIRDALSTVKGDVYLFPEMFLSGYGAEIPDSEALEAAEKELRSLSVKFGSALAIGMPRRENGRVYNSLTFITPEKTQTYDKIHLANFGKYDESIFSPGGRPLIVEWKGMKFGLLICYDILFPELSRYYAVNGADAILMASASAIPSKLVMKTMLPARSLENTVYTVFCNNIGPFGDDRFFGGSAVHLPSGETVIEASEEEEILVFDLDPEALHTAREKRPHLRDRRTDVYRNG